MLNKKQGNMMINVAHTARVELSYGLQCGIGRDREDGGRMIELQANSWRK